MSNKKRPATYYYKMTISSENPQAMGCVSRDEKGFDKTRLGKLDLIEDWPEGITIGIKGEDESDIFLVAHDWRVISSRLRQALEDCAVKDAQFLPVQAVHEETGDELGTYWTIHVTRKVEALDGDRTIWKKPSSIEDKYPRDQYPALYIMEKALKSDALQGIDLFRLSIKGYLVEGFFISKRIKEHIENRKSTAGLHFVKIPTY
jgi:hypothetical protein